MFRKFFHNGLPAVAGFTLPELIIYVAIAAMVLVSLLQFSWDILGAGVKVEVANELTQNGRLVLERVTQRVRAAEGLLAGASTLGVNPSVLVLDFPGASPDITFDTYLTTVNQGGEILTIRKLRIQDGSAADLTSNQINVTDFTVRNLTRGTERENLQITLTLRAAETGQDPLRDRSITLQTSASVRH